MYAYYNSFGKSRPTSVCACAVVSVRVQSCCRQTNGWNLGLATEPEASAVACAVATAVGAMSVISMDSRPLPPPPPSSSSPPPLSPPPPPPLSSQTVATKGLAATVYHSRASSRPAGSPSSAAEATSSETAAVVAAATGRARVCRGGDEHDDAAEDDEDGDRSFRRLPTVSSSYTVTATWSLSLSHSSTSDRCALTNRSNTSTPETSVCTATSAVLATDDLW